MTKNKGTNPALDNEWEELQKEYTQLTKQSMSDQSISKKTFDLRFVPRADIDTGERIREIFSGRGDGERLEDLVGSIKYFGGLIQPILLLDKASMVGTVPHGHFKERPLLLGPQITGQPGSFLLRFRWNLIGHARSHGSTTRRIWKNMKIGQR